MKSKRIIEDFDKYQVVEQLWDFCKHPDLDDVVHTGYFALWNTSERGGMGNLSGPGSFRNNSIRYYRSKCHPDFPDNFYYEFIFNGRCFYPVCSKEEYIDMVLEHVKTEKDILEIQKALKDAKFYRSVRRMFI